MFRISDYCDANCALCEKEKRVFVVTCERGTFNEKPLCLRCFEKQAALHVGASKTATAAFSSLNEKNLRDD